MRGITNKTVETCRGFLLYYKGEFIYEQWVIPLILVLLLSGIF